MDAGSGVAAPVGCLFEFMLARDSSLVGHVMSCCLNFEFLILLALAVMPVLKTTAFLKNKECTKDVQFKCRGAFVPWHVLGKPHSREQF